MQITIDISDASLPQIAVAFGLPASDTATAATRLTSFLTERARTLVVDGLRIQRAKADESADVVAANAAVKTVSK